MENSCFPLDLSHHSYLSSFLIKAHPCGLSKLASEPVSFRKPSMIQLAPVSLPSASLPCSKPLSPVSTTNPQWLQASRFSPRASVSSSDKWT